MDFGNLEVETTTNSVKKPKFKKGDIPDFSIGDTTEIESEGDDGINRKKSNDAMIIEYCPRVFRELRNFDEYNAEEVDM